MDKDLPGSSRHRPGLHAAPGDRLDPLYVDLDGTLLRSDLLVESALRFIATRPARAWRLLAWLARGKAVLKSELAQSVPLDPQCLPYDEELLGFLRQQKAAGRRLVLATASHESYARCIAAHLDLFDAVIASDGRVNRKGAAKLEAIRLDAGGPFSYAGNDAVDCPIWREARSAVVVGAAPAVGRRAAELTAVERQFSGAWPAGLRVWLQAIRLHQWAKNLLLFLPALPIATALDLRQWGLLLAGFLAFGLCASSVYLLNDLTDLDADRAHPRKRRRPLASGALPLQAGVAMAGGLLVAAFALATALLPPAFVGTLAVYWASTLAYSLLLKRRVLLDVLVLAGLYSLRIVAGAAVLQQMPSFWILSFSMFLFLSLACVKRYIELRDLAQQAATARVAGRGYLVSDLPFVQAMGVASGFVSVLVFAMYVHDPATAENFAVPQALWLICLLVLFWVSRVWLKASRMELHDDPVVFAVKDRPSQITLGLSMLTLAAALSL